jgi:hypothetical protein
MGEYPGREVLQIYLSLGSALFLTMAAVLIGVFLYRDEFLNHKIIWKYVGGVVSAYAAWRWVLLFAINEDLESAFSALTAWIQPINQMFAILLGITFTVIALTFRSGIKDE